MTDVHESRSVAGVIPATRTVEGDGFVVWRPFPTADLDMVDPFLLLDEMGPVAYGPGEAKGASDHPHRGFETVTYALEGGIEHRDSAGHHGLIGPGEVQWMTAGSGVVHSEQPSDGMRRAGGRLHGVQLWVNLRSDEKMTAPRYQGITVDEIPVVSVPGGRVRVIAGEVDGQQGAVDTHSPVTYVHATVERGATIELPAPAGHNAIASIVGGRGSFGPDRTPAAHHDLVLFDRDGDQVLVHGPDGGDEPLDVLVITGEPLGEPVARYGPFVMNTRAEIIQAFDDYQSGRMGRIGVD